MCGGALGKFQNFRHNAQMGFGLVPKNSLAGKITGFERKAEDYVSSSDSHMTKEERAKKEAAATAQAAANEANAIDAAKTSVAAQQEAQAASDAIQRANLEDAIATTEQKQARASTLLELAKADEEKKKQTTTTKTTLLGG